jgi:recombination protein RecT
MGKDLSSRVATREDTATNGDVATRPASLEQQIKNMHNEFQMAMPRGMEAARLVRDALTALRRVPNLARCDKLSVLGSLMTCSQLGLRPNTPLGHAWVLPFWNKNLQWTDEQGRVRKGGYEAQLIIGYQGYRELVQRTGIVSTVIAHVVYEADTFEVEYGLDERITHRPRLDGDRGEAVGYYAIIRYTSGSYTLAYLSRSEAEAHRDRYAMARTKENVIVGPWRDNFDQMALKSAFLRAAKWAPKSTELAYAIEADERIRVNTSRELEAIAEGTRPELEAGPGADVPETDGTTDEPDPAATAVVQPANQGQMKRIFALLKERGIGEDGRHAAASTALGRDVTSFTELSADDASTLIARLEQADAEASNGTAT